MNRIRRFHPGVYIKDSLEAMEMTSRELSIRTGISERTLSAVINGNGDITFDIAYKLSLYFDNSINYWMNLQTQYDLYLREQEEEQDFNNDWELIKGIKKYLLDYSYISNSDDKETIILKVRQLVGVNKLSLLNKKDSFVCLKEQNAIDTSNYFYQNFWIALALKEARKKNGIPYDKKKLLNSIDDIKQLIIEEPSVFYPKLQKIFEDCGISFVLLPYLSKSNIYGATKWFSKDNVMLAISNRGEKADLFWFTLFHELSHVLMEHRRETLFSFENGIDNEADLMASNMLIEKNEWDNFINKKNYTSESILDFSEKMRVLPCIVLGRLHKEKIVPYGVLDKKFNVSYQIV